MIFIFSIYRFFSARGKINEVNFDKKIIIFLLLHICKKNTHTLNLFLLHILLLFILVYERISLCLIYLFFKHKFYFLFYITFLIFVNHKYLLLKNCY